MLFSEPRSLLQQPEVQFHDNSVGACVWSSGKCRKYSQSENCLPIFSFSADLKVEGNFCRFWSFVRIYQLLVLTYQTDIHNQTVYICSSISILLSVSLASLFYNTDFLFVLCPKHTNQKLSPSVPCVCKKNPILLSTVPCSEHHRRHPRQCGLLGYDNTRGTSHNKRRCRVS